MFLNTENISVRGSGALILDKVIYQMSCEKPIKGNLTGTELSLSAYKSFKDKLHIEGQARYNTRNNAYGGYVELGYELGAGWRLMGALDYENGKNGGTWAGQRRYHILDNKSEFAKHLQIQKRF